MGQPVPDRDFLVLLGEHTVPGRNFSGLMFPQCSPVR